MNRKTDGIWSKLQANGLAVFSIVVMILLLAVTVWANVSFNRLLKSQQDNQASQTVSDSTTATAAVARPALSVSPILASTAKDTKAKMTGTTFSPPAENTMPDDDYGKVIQLGQKIFMETGKYAPQYVGNNLNCVNCHLDAGRKSDSSPLWAAFVHYPAFRSKTGKVDTLASRIQGCFLFSMNGKAPPLDDAIMTALQTYAFWLAQGAAVGMPMTGSGYPKLKKPAQPADYVRGEKLYAQNCALCHGADGQGVRSGEQQIFPPLWGKNSFNWGAGMHQIANAAGFIQANMPLGKGGSLSEQESWDLAMYMNSHERPQDPRFIGSTAETRKKYHDTDDSMYGRSVNGHVLGLP